MSWRDRLYAWIRIRIAIAERQYNSQDVVARILGIIKKAVWEIGLAIIVTSVIGGPIVLLIISLIDEGQQTVLTWVVTVLGVILGLIGTRFGCRVVQDVSDKTAADNRNTEPQEAATHQE